MARPDDKAFLRLRLLTMPCVDPVEDRTRVRRSAVEVKEGDAVSVRPARPLRCSADDVDGRDGQDAVVDPAQDDGVGDETTRRSLVCGRPGTCSEPARAMKRLLGVHRK
ncbi:hypothetical protein [Streptomyces sp. NPDC020965]|uniref:hypothetical protein n=1 Tax=Streptomyces sp. NPDC020965 TaxID=3365105 RepID=UPI00379A713D